MSVSSGCADSAARRAYPAFLCRADERLARLAVRRCALLRGGFLQKRLGPLVVALGSRPLLQVSAESAWRVLRGCAFQFTTIHRTFTLSQGNTRRGDDLVQDGHIRSINVPRAPSPTTSRHS